MAPNPGTAKQSSSTTTETQAQTSKAKPKPAEFVIPAENIVAPDQIDECAVNLKRIYSAIREFEKDKNRLPNSLTELVPEYIGKETLRCPHDPANARGGSDPKSVHCSYTYEFTLIRVSSEWPVIGGMRFSDWKRKQVEFFGDVVPMVRCNKHGSKYLNVSVSGKTYVSPLVWERMFIPGYTHGDEFRDVQTDNSDSRREESADRIGTARGPEEVSSNAQQDALEVISTIPQTPTILSFGEKLRVNVRYHLTSAEQARIWVRPYTEGKRTSSYRAHPSPSYKAGSGEMEGWFYFNRQTKVDEIRVRMVSADSQEPIATASIPVNVEWQPVQQVSVAQNLVEVSPSRHGKNKAKKVLIIYGDKQNADGVAALLESQGMECTAVPMPATNVKSPEHYDLVITLPCCSAGYCRQTWDSALLNDIGDARVLACGDAGAALLQTKSLLVGHPNGWHGTRSPKRVFIPETVTTGPFSTIFTKPYNLLSTNDETIIEIHSGTEELEHIGIYDSGKFPKGTYGIGREEKDTHHWMICKQGNYTLWGADSRIDNLTEQGKELFVNLCLFLAEAPSEPLVFPEKQYLTEGKHESLLKGGARDEYTIAIEKPGKLRLTLEWDGDNSMMFMSHKPLTKRVDGRSPLEIVHNVSEDMCRKEFRLVVHSFQLPEKAECPYSISISYETRQSATGGTSQSAHIGHVKLAGESAFLRRYAGAGGGRRDWGVVLNTQVCAGPCKEALVYSELFRS